MTTANPKAFVILRPDVGAKVDRHNPASWSVHPVEKVSPGTVQIPAAPAPPPPPWHSRTRATTYHRVRLARVAGFAPTQALAEAMVQMAVAGWADHDAAMTSAAAAQARLETRHQRERTAAALAVAAARRGAERAALAAAAQCLAIRGTNP